MSNNSTPITNDVFKKNVKSEIVGGFGAYPSPGKTLWRVVDGVPVRLYAENAKSITINLILDTHMPQDEEQWVLLGKFQVVNNRVYWKGGAEGEISAALEAPIDNIQNQAPDLARLVSGKRKRSPKVTKEKKPYEPVEIMNHKGEMVEVDANVYSHIITCECGTERRIKPQDKFQVKRCVPCQKKHVIAQRNAATKARRLAAKQRARTEIGIELDTMDLSKVEEYLYESGVPKEVDLTVLEYHVIREYAIEARMRKNRVAKREVTELRAAIKAVKAEDE